MVNEIMKALKLWDEVNKEVSGDSVKIATIVITSAIFHLINALYSNRTKQKKELNA